jgi:hypothetical protein
MCEKQNTMKTIILTLSALALLSLTSCGKIVSNETNKFNLHDVPTKDKYSSLIIQSSHSKQAGQKIGNKVLNDRVTLDIYVPEYSSSKGKDVCRFYKEYYKTMANKLDGLLEVEVNLFDSKNSTGKKEGNISYKGGIFCNYAIERYDENILN